MSAIRNVVIILVDTLRSPNASVSSGVDPRMRFLSSLSGAGFPLDRFLASSSWTIPSHQALLCGDRPDSTPLELIEDRSQRSRRTLSRLWTEAGGQSIAVSQNPIVNVEGGVLQGFDLGYPRARLGLQRLMLMTGNQLDRVLLSKVATGPPGPELAGTVRPPLRDAVSRSARPFANAVSALSLRLRGVDRALARLKIFLRGSRPGRPLFLFVNLMEAHEPYQTGPHGSSAFGGPWSAPTNSLAAHSASIAATPGVGPAVRRAYSTGLQDADTALARTFAFLAKEIDMSRTLTLVVSDHGQALGERGFYGHGSFLYDELVHVPCLVLGKLEQLEPTLRELRGDWIDHTHLYDFLSELMALGIDLPGPDRIRDRVRSRGVASSFVSSRPDPQVGSPTAFGAVRRLRLESERSHVVAEERQGTTRVAESVGALSAELAEQAISTLRRTRAPEEALRRGDEVESRLASWGYA